MQPTEFDLMALLDELEGKGLLSFDTLSESEIMEHLKAWLKRMEL